MKKENKSKRLNILKKVLLLILIAIGIYASITMYKFYVIHKVLNGIRSYSQYSNYYYKVSTTAYDGQKRISEYWNNNGTAINKSTVIVKSAGTSTMIWVDKNGGYLYDISKKMARKFNSDSLFSKVPISLVDLYSVVYGIPDIQFELLFALLPNVSIIEKKVNDTEHYVIRLKDSEEIWINKETLFPLKTICFDSRVYEYEFIPNIVTDEDVLRPDLTEYTITEMN